MESWHLRFCNAGNTHDDECNCSERCSCLAEVRHPAAAAVAVFSCSCRCDRRWEEGGVLGSDDVGDGFVCLEKIIRRRTKKKMHANVSRVKMRVDGQEYNRIDLSL